MYQPLVSILPTYLRVAYPGQVKYNVAHNIRFPYVDLPRTKAKCLQMKPGTSSKVATLSRQYVELSVLYIDLFLTQDNIKLRSTGSARCIEEPSGISW
jgi:hypothetical protein